MSEVTQMNWRAVQVTLERMSARLYAFEERLVEQNRKIAALSGENAALKQEVILLRVQSATGTPRTE
jgi:cell division protein FtsB